VTWHVDDLKLSHIDPKVNDKFLKWLKKKYTSNKIGEIKTMQGNKHDYFAMTLHFLTPGVFKVDMASYVGKMLQEFPLKFKGKSSVLGVKTYLKLMKHQISYLKTRLKYPTPLL
jgi:hypothetical protein